MKVRGLLGPRTGSWSTRGSLLIVGSGSPFGHPVCLSRGQRRADKKAWGVGELGREIDSNQGRGFRLWRRLPCCEGRCRDKQGHSSKEHSTHGSGAKKSWMACFGQRITSRSHGCAPVSNGRSEYLDAGFGPRLFVHPTPLRTYSGNHALYESLIMLELTARFGRLPRWHFRAIAWIARLTMPFPRHLIKEAEVHSCQVKCQNNHGSSSCEMQ